MADVTVGFLTMSAGPPSLSFLLLQALGHSLKHTQNLLC